VYIAVLIKQLSCLDLYTDICFISGNTVTYTNWEGGHRNHASLDCAVLQPVKNGTWDDRDCSSGLLSIIGLDSEDRYYGFCEFGKNQILVTCTIFQTEKQCGTFFFLSHFVEISF